MNLQPTLPAAITTRFNEKFQRTHNTILVGGFSEPYYQPSHDGKPAEIRFTRDYPSSALHEIAHWCIAGDERRKLPDYGYWYRPDGRNAEEQKEFFQAEVKPQALEKAFSEKLGIEFRVSCDNLNGRSSDVMTEKTFEAQVCARLLQYRQEGFPERAREFLAN